MIEFQAGISWLLIFLYDEYFLKVSVGIYYIITRYRRLIKATPKKFLYLKNEVTATGLKSTTT